MKGLFYAVMFALATSLTQAQHVTVDSERRPNVDFSHYKTYVWASQMDNKLNPEQYYQNGLIVQKQLQDAVGHAMDGRGYKLTNQSPDLIVNVKVLEKPTTIKTYTGYFSRGELQTLGTQKDITVHSGTILINLVDTKTDQAVWQGLASGLTSGSDIDHQEGQIREAVNLIFTKYPYQGDSF